MFMNEEKIRDLMDVSISEYVNEQGIEDDRIKRYLKMACAAIMVCPFLDRVSTGEFIENVKEVLDKGSVYYPRGGWNSFFDPLITTIQKNGGIVQKQTLVERIEVKDGQAVGVKIKGKDEIIEAKHVINTVPVQKIFDHLLDPSLTDEEFVENCEGLRYTTGIAIDFALSRPVTDIDGIMMLEKPAGFGFVPSNLSPELVPNGKSLMTFFIPLNKEDMDTEEKRKLHYRELRDMVLLHFPEIDDVLEFERPLYFDMVDGVECAVDQHKYIRPGNTVPGIENLWLTGDSAGGHGSGGDIGHTSVRECFKKIKKTWTSGN